MKKYPVELDFQGVFSLGSAFGDEVLFVISKKQKEVLAINTNLAVKACLEKVALDGGIGVVFRA